MRLLHTSDWHLGRSLHGVDLLEHQAAYLDHLVDLARSERVDAVLVAGDVYDRAVPPVEAVTLLSETLTRLAEVTTVVVTPGNHDSAARLGFGAGLMRPELHVRARVDGIATPVVVTGSDGVAVLVYALPYLDPDVVRRELGGTADAGGSVTVAREGVERGDLATGEAPGEEGDADDARAPALARSHEAVLGAAMARVRADLAQRAAAGPVRSVVMAHAFVVGGEPSDSERDIRVGGVDHVPAGVFAGVDYVALGHLHGPQRVADGVRYSGSPLAYSFSEQHQRKSTVLVEVTDAGLVGEVLVAAPVPRRLADLTGTLDDLLGPAGDAHLDDWLRITVTDAARPPGMYVRLKERFPHALVMQHRSSAASGIGGAVAISATRDPLEVAGEFVEHVTGTPATPGELAALRRAWKRVTAAERSA
ncbi:exonuclease SbcCD subunit D [Cellulomonas sp. P24]|uniref:exonuclease SbcCD subunit D n=1 Tax=Cellulomonas sp. P24 TaxID=2885206 RepID=UPI00216B6700|nr:exonuclease SbcCD subunit D [Cellulomonas sp. P24]MCR6492947.1 exonuclease SbcCD subunit D [Cellulomonas sp. P24]